MRVSREPAENTSTSPLGLALAELEGPELEDAAPEDVVLEEELLQPAAARTVQAMAARATAGALLLVNSEIIPRTLPLMVASRKKQRHYISSSARRLGPARKALAGRRAARHC
jgi:hypothetical protein